MVEKGLDLHKVSSEGQSCLSDIPSCVLWVQALPSCEMWVMMRKKHDDIPKKQEGFKNDLSPFLQGVSIMYEYT